MLEDVARHCNTTTASPEKIARLLEEANATLDKGTPFFKGDPRRTLFENQRISCRWSAQVILAHGRGLPPGLREALSCFIDRHPQFLEGQRYRFTTDWHSEFVPRWQGLLRPLVGKPHLQFLEIGSLEGRSACWLLDHVLTHETARLTCIDLFDSVPHEWVRWSELSPLSREALFDSNIAQSGAGEKVTKLTGRSQTILRSLPLESFDFIYVDGSHVAKDVLEDGVLSWGLLKTGGLLVFDDYAGMESAPPEHLPTIAIDALLTVFAGHFELLDKGTQVTLRKLS